MAACALRHSNRKDPECTILACLECDFSHTLICSSHVLLNLDKYLKSPEAGGTVTVMVFLCTIRLERAPYEARKGGSAVDPRASQADGSLTWVPCLSGNSFLPGRMQNLAGPRPPRGLGFSIPAARQQGNVCVASRCDPGAASVLPTLQRLHEELQDSVCRCQ